jgi:hypothetical protein
MVISYSKSPDWQLDLSKPEGSCWIGPYMLLMCIKPDNERLPLANYYDRNGDIVTEYEV